MREQREPGVVRGDYWHPIEDGRRTQCDLCPRACTLKDGQRGFCFVRKAQDGGIALTSYGRATGFCVDPIEKKPLYHFYPGTSVLSFGTAGCNLGCRFCQNWDISKAREIERLSAEGSPEQIARAAADAGCKSIAFTYNDPVIFAEYAIDCAHAARERGIKAVAVTAGYISPEARPAFFGAMDATNVDLKAFTDDFYDKLCFAELGPVLDTLCWLKEDAKVWLEVTTLLIPGRNDSEGEVQRLCEWFVKNLGAETPLHFSAFHPDFKLQDSPRTPASTVIRARRQALDAGLKHVYVGNIAHDAGQITACANCGQELLSRSGYRVTNFRLNERGACYACETPLRGYFERMPGRFGSRRIPLAISP
jgi:pyruvate formate lyase activating enzyme